MKKLTALVLLFSFPSFSSELVIEGIRKGQPAPFDGVVMDADSAATVISEREYEIKKCDIKVEHEKKKEKSICDLNTKILEATLKAEQEKYEACLLYTSPSPRD